jgi:hypothetical protein
MPDLKLLTSGFNTKRKPFPIPGGQKSRNLPLDLLLFISAKVEKELD